MNTAQVLLVVVVTVLTTLLIVVGIQVFFILKEVRRTIEKTNKILDDAGEISEAVSKPISTLSNSIVSFSGIVGFLNWLVERRRKKSEGGENEREE